MAVACAPLAGGWEIGGPGHALGGLFTEAELAAADLLVQLSSSGEAVTGETESPRSVNTCAGAAAWAEEEREAVLGLELDRRARKRYRLVSELYDATRPVTGAGVDAGSARKRKRGHRTEAEMAMRYGTENKQFLGF